MSDKATLKAFFETGDIPTEEQYGELIDSSINTDDTADQSLESNLEVKKNIAIQRTETSDAPIHIGNLTDTIVANPAVLVQRGIDVGAGTSGHAFVDQSIVTSAESGYNSFDSRVDFINTASISHYAGFQTRLHLDGSGLVPNVYGFYHNNPIGSGPVTNHYGLYIEQLNAGTVTNYSIYTVGSTPSVFGGKVRIGSNDDPTVALDITGEMSMTGTSFIHDSNGSAYHIIDRGASLSHDAFIWYKTGGVSKWLTGIGVSGGEASNEDYRITDGNTTRFKIEQSTGNVEIDKNILIKGQATANDDTIKTFTPTPTFDFNGGNDQQMTLTGNVTTFATSNEVGSANYKVYLINDATPGRTVAAPTGWTVDPTSETHTTAANAINLYQFYTLPDGSKYYNNHIVKS